MLKRITVLFLYTRLPDYFYQCALHFVRNYSANVVIIRYADDVNTKYTFDPDPSIRLVYKHDIALDTFVRNLSPDAIVVSGWSDKHYNRLAKAYKATIPVTLALDNPWLGTLKQRILTAASFMLRNSFNAVWVAGMSQYEYAGRLGFPKSRIYSDLYCADTNKFYESSVVNRSVKQQAYPKRLVYLGRLVAYKQPLLLAQVFNDLVKREKYPWKLVIAGEGPLKQTISKQGYDHVLVEDFVAPGSLVKFYREAGAFCLPSIHEHWGLAVHEAAAAGLPLLLSDTVESGSAFLINHYNGYSFATHDRASLEKCLQQLMNLSDEHLLLMSDNSVALSSRITHSYWSAQLNSIVNAGAHA